jgi:hypothetical protein
LIYPSPEQRNFKRQNEVGHRRRIAFRNNQIVRQPAPQLCDSSVPCMLSAKKLRMRTAPQITSDRTRQRNAAF